MEQLLHTHQPDLIALQETHIKYPDRYKLKPYSIIREANAKEKRAKVLIALKTGTQVSIMKVQADKEGRFLGLLVEMGSITITLVSVYAPNTEQEVFLKTVLSNLEQFGQGEMILMGDLNIVWGPCTR